MVQRATRTDAIVDPSGLCEMGQKECFTAPVPASEPSTTIAVMICTRGRPLRLRDCISALFEMDVPKGVSPLLIVVENDDLPNCQGIILDLLRFAPADWEIRYSHEPRLGIPFARNHALNVALEMDV